jgi:hypothetical protein
MTNQYPNLKVVVSLFEKNKISHHICYEYIKDESFKFIHIYEAYCKKLAEIL